MSAISPFSKKRLASIASGEVRLQGRSTIERMSAEEYREKDQAHKNKLWDALYGMKPDAKKNARRKAIDAADKWFSEFIRLRDSDENGRVKCVTCSHWGHWRQLQCGHFVTRGHQSTRYDEQNSSCQCRGCNYNGGQHLKHATAIDMKHGEGTSKRLEGKGRIRCSRTTSDFLFIANTYRERVEAIQRNSPGKFIKAS